MKEVYHSHKGIFTRVEIKYIRVEIKYIRLEINCIREEMKYTRMEIKGHAIRGQGQVLLLGNCRYHAM